MIPQTAEYALRAVVFLAMHERQTASAQEISECVHVPVGYLQKVLRRLVRAGTLTAQRGMGGGFGLAAPPEDISVLDVLSASDWVAPRIERCPLGIKDHTRLCPLHRLLDSQVASAEQVFASTSIADLVDGEGGIRALCDHGGCLPLSVSVKPKEPPARRKSLDHNHANSKTNSDT